MEVSINVEDYLDQDEIKDEIKSTIRGKINKDAERILHNTAYYGAFGAIDEALDEYDKEMIKDKVRRVIDNLNEFSVFRHDIKTKKSQSPAERINQEAQEELRGLIYQKVTEAINAYDFKRELQASDMLQEYVIEALSRGIKSIEKHGFEGGFA